MLLCRRYAADMLRFMPQRDPLPLIISPMFHLPPPCLLPALMRCRVHTLRYLFFADAGAPTLPNAAPRHIRWLSVIFSVTPRYAMRFAVATLLRERDAVTPRLLMRFCR